MNISDEEMDRHRKTILAWHHKDPVGLLRYLRGIWAYADWGWDEEDAEEDGTKFRRYRISTAGWSDNESLMEAIEQNRWFWVICWYSSRRGGHYEFRIPWFFLTEHPHRGDP